MLGFKLDLFLDPTSKIASILHNKGVLILQWLKVMWTVLEREAE